MPVSIGQSVTGPWAEAHIGDTGSVIAAYDISTGKRVVAMHLHGKYTANARTDLFRLMCGTEGFTIVPRRHGPAH